TVNVDGINLRTHCKSRRAASVTGSHAPFCQLDTVAVLGGAQMLRVRSRLLCALLLVAAATATAGAQEFRATVKGQVADTSQAALPGATVTVQNLDTNEV